jgi:collagenase-like PrtC family protease
MKAATQQMKDGVAAVTVSPTSKAADAVEKWAEGVRRAKEEGTYEAGLRSVSNEQWKQAMLTKGIPHVSEGVNLAQPKMERFLGELLNHTEMVKAQLDQMPDTTPEDRVQKMIRNVELMREFKFKRRR